MPLLAPVIITTFPDKFLSFRTSNAVLNVSTFTLPLTFGLVFSAMRGSIYVVRPFIELKITFGQTSITHFSLQKLF